MLLLFILAPGIGPGHASLEGNLSSSVSIRIGTLKCNKVSVALIRVSSFFLSVILSNKTIDDNLNYIPDNDYQNYIGRNRILGCLSHKHPKFYILYFLIRWLKDFGTFI